MLHFITFNTYLYIILDVLFVNQIETDVLDSLKNVLDTISNSCSYNAKQTSMAALVRSTKIVLNYHFDNLCF